MIDYINPDDVLWGSEQPEDACVNYERCQNIVPHNGEMCGDCLDDARRKRREHLKNVSPYK